MRTAEEIVNAIRELPADDRRRVVERVVQELARSELGRGAATPGGTVREPELATAIASGPSPEASSAEREAAIQELVDAGRIREARGLAHGTRWERVLGVPRTRAGAPATGADPRPNLRWLRDASGRAPYAGQWVALLGGRVLLASTNLGEIRRQLEGRSDVRDVLVERIAT